jgi:DNA-binding LacI/PurR family transcriptional regulator
MATIKEIAKRAKVSVGTVSKVLTNTPYVADETRARIQRVIDEAGYKPSFAGRALSGGRTYNIGVIFPHRGADRFFSDPYQITVLQAIERVISENEYNLLLSAPMIPFKDARQFQRLIGSGYLDGAITFEIIPDAPLRPHLEAQKIPCISVDYHPLTKDKNTVYVNDFVGAHALTTYALAQGHRRIGLITVSFSTIATWDHRMGGYKAAIEEAGLDFAQIPYVVGEFTTESGRDALDALLKEFAPDAPPTLIICFNDRMAIGAIQRLQALGFRVPEQVSVVGFDDIPVASTQHPALTTVRQPGDLLGKRAAEILMNWLSTSAERREIPAEGFAPEVLASELVIRDSCAPVERG